MTVINLFLPVPAVLLFLPGLNVTMNRRLPRNCAFWNNDSGHTLVSSCPYVFPERLFLNRTLRLAQNVHSLNSYLCHHLSRDQDNIVCGRCTSDTGPAVNSVGSQCVQCHPLNVLYFILLHLLPATIIFVVLLLVQFEVQWHFIFL